MQTHTPLNRDLDDLVLQARGLELVRDLLAQRGTPDDQLDAFDHELQQVRRRLVAKVV